MKKILPHIEIGLDKNSSATVRVEDYELFDFVDDFVTEVCGLDWQNKTVSEDEYGDVYTLHFNPKHSLTEIEKLLLQLNPKEIKQIYAVNN